MIPTKVLIRYQTETIDPERAYGSTPSPVDVDVQSSTAELVACALHL